MDEAMTPALAKEEGMALVLKNAKTHWRALTASLIWELARSGDPFTGDDLRALAAYRLHPEPHHPNAWGGAMNGAAKRGRIEKTGRYVKSSAVSRHAAIVTEWVGVRIDAFEAELAAARDEWRYDWEAGR